MNSKAAILAGLILGFGVLAGAMCPMEPPANGNSNANANSSNNANSNSAANENENSGSSDRFRLKVNWEGEGFGSSLAGAAVWVFIDDARVTRADGDYRTGPNTTQFIRSANNANRLREFDVPAGKTVTIIAFEDAGKILNLFLGAVPMEPAETTQIEFVSMSGDIDATPEAGVGTLVMDEDKEVTVTFQPMPTVIVNNPFQGRYDLQLEVFGWLNHPSLNGVSPTAECEGSECITQCLGSSTWDGDVLHLAFKTGTRLTITSVDCNASQFPWVGWEAGDNCTDRTCILTFGLDGRANAEWKMN